MVRLGVKCIVFLVVVDITSTLVNNTQIEARNKLEDQQTRRQLKKHRSTSSSEDAESKGSGDNSLGLSESVSETDSDARAMKNHDKPKSSAERKEWRKWHRKCPRCPEEMKKKWRDPTIKWICGAFQRARRSFKSLCMMHYRNCQDGTMFTKIHDHRCENSSIIQPHGDHFFYEYRVALSDDESNSKSESETTIEDSSSSA